VRRLAQDAAWWAQDYAYAAAWQLRAAVDRTDPVVYATGDRVPLVVLPGVYETWRFLQPLIAELHARGHPVHVVAPARRNERPVGELAALAADVLVDRALHDAVLVAHSKGGLVGKTLMTRSDAGRRIRGMVAVATPFGGSRYARWMVGRTLRSFAPADATIRALTRETAVNARIVSIYGRFDPHIPERSELAGAKNVELETGGHFRILAHPRVIAEVVAMAE
jgi:alpha-beta hydrolase superfamily lysophospholipase